MIPPTKRTGFRRIALYSDAALVVLLSAACVALLFTSTGFEADGPPTRRAKGDVLSVDNSGLFKHGLIRTGTQALSVRFASGDMTGRTVNVSNNLSGQLERDELFSEGQAILVEYSFDGDTVTAAVARGHYRLGIEMVLALLFAVLLVAVGGWTGVKALVSFVFAALMIWKIMLPAFLHGYDPIWTGLAVAASLIAAVSFLVGGLGRKGLITFLGSLSGLCIAALLASIFTAQLKIHGAVRPFSETLLYSGFHDLDLARLFVAGVFVACSGAVMDLAMDISASMEEIVRKKPGMDFFELFLSGMRVGRVVIGSMTTTLLLAYSGMSMAMMMLFIGQGVPLPNILNLTFVSAEILNTLVGSFGLVAVAPLTAFVGAAVWQIGRNRPVEPKDVAGFEPRPEAETHCNGGGSGQ